MKSLRLEPMIVVLIVAKVGIAFLPTGKSAPMAATSGRFPALWPVVARSDRPKPEKSQPDTTGGIKLVNFARRVYRSLANASGANVDATQLV